MLPDLIPCNDCNKKKNQMIERFDQLQKEYKHLGGNGASDRLRAELELLPMED